MPIKDYGIEASEMVAFHGDLAHVVRLHDCLAVFSTANDESNTTTEMIVTNTAVNVVTVVVGVIVTRIC